jgi:hypothetical protein
MKFIFTIACYLIFASPVWSRSDGTPMGMMTYGVASEARAEFEATGTWPPMEKLNSVEQYALRAKAPKELVFFNSLAGVPGTPILKADGVKVRYPGFRLYAISRIPNFERAYTPEGKKTGGRYAVLFKEQNGNPVIMEIPWIIESEAQIILQQIGGFDPKKAPFVFEDTYVKLGGDLEKLYENNNPTKLNKHPLSPVESKLRDNESPEASSQQENSKKDTSLERPDKSRPSGESNSSDAIHKESDHFSWGIIGGSIGLLVVALAAWLKLRNSKSNF